MFLILLFCFLLEKDILLLIIIYRFLSKILNYMILIYFELGKQKFSLIFIPLMKLNNKRKNYLNN